MKLLEKNRGSKNLSINTLQEIALQDLSSSINTISTETYSVSSSLVFLFHALCPHSTYIYLSKSEQLCCSVDQNISRNHREYSDKMIFMLWKYLPSFLFVYTYFQMVNVFTKRWDENEKSRYFCIITVIFVAEIKLTTCIQENR